MSNAFVDAMDLEAMEFDHEGGGPSGSSRAGTIVLGLGNTVLSDDGVGIAIIQALERMLPYHPFDDVELVTSTRAGFDLLDLLSGYRNAIIVDCLAVPNPEPGRIRRLQLANVSGSMRLVGGHDMSIGVAFQLAEHLGIPMPSSVTIMAIEGEDTVTLHEGLTPRVAAAVETAAVQVMDELHRIASTTLHGALLP